MLIFDIETDGFLDVLTKVHMINVVDSETSKRYRFNNENPAVKDFAGTLEEGMEMLEASSEIGGHNVQKFDIPALKKVYPEFNPQGYVWDSLPLARLVWSDVRDRDFRAMEAGRLSKDFAKNRLVGRHSIEAWGWRLGEHKGDFEGPWETYTEEMDDYCMQDVIVNLKLFELIWGKDYSAEALKLENDVFAIICRQELKGVLFDKSAAEALLSKLMARRAELEDKLRDTFKPWFAPKYTKGSFLFTPKTNNKTLGYSKGAEMCRVKLNTFNPASTDHIADRMIKLFDWQPTERTPTGKPKVDEETLSSLPYPEAKLCVEYLMINKRIGALAEGDQAWLKKMEDDDRIHGSVNSNGAVTGRMTHNHPNLAQVPAARAPYGKECRALFTIPEGYRLVGCDAEGLELRCLAHFLHRYDGGAYADTVLNGDKKLGTDIHTLNQKATGMRTRDGAKTLMYAYLYGAGDYKIGTTYVDDFGDEKKARFYARFPSGRPRDRQFKRLGLKKRKELEGAANGLSELQGAIQRAVKSRGFLRGLDGRRVKVRSAHAALNTLLQGAGALVMKKALVILDASLSTFLTPGVDYEFVLNVHDEFQIEVLAEHAPRVAETAEAAIAEAGEHFGFRCPLAGAADVGETWLDTH